MSADYNTGLCSSRSQNLGCSTALCSQLLNSRRLLCVFRTRLTSDDDRYPAALSSAMSEYEFERRIQKINDDLANNAPCFSCTVGHTRCMRGFGVLSPLAQIFCSSRIASHLCCWLLHVRLRFVCVSVAAIFVLSMHSRPVACVRALHVRVAGAARTAERPGAGEPGRAARRQARRVEPRTVVLRHMDSNRTANLNERICVMTPARSACAQFVHTSF
jgi:hypothetical protein